MAKRTMIQRALRGARGVVRDYVRPGARSAEQTIDDLLETLGDLRKQLAAQRGRFGGARRRKSSKRAATKRSVKRRVKRVAKKSRRSTARRKKRS